MRLQKLYFAACLGDLPAYQEWLTPATRKNLVTT
jgi:hypothetical protein